MISVVIITKNEEENIDRCLKSVKWAKEIIILDSHSTDKTCDIARKYTDKVFSTEWQGYGKTKNKGIMKAKHDWILSIDADEVITNELHDEILNVINQNKYDGYYIPRRLYFCNKSVRFGGVSPDYQLRLFRKNKGNFNDVDVHEKLILSGAAGYLKNKMLHYSYSNINEYFDRFNMYTSLDAKRKKKQGKKFSIFCIFVFFWEIFRRLILKLGVLDGVPGIMYHVFSGMSSFVKYAKLYDK